MVPKCETNTRTRNNSIPSFNCRTNCFRYSFFPSTLNDCFFSFYPIRPVQTNIYNDFDPKGLTFLTRLRLGLSHLNERRFWHSFQDCLNPLCSCSLEIEGTSRYLLHCHYFSHHRVVIMNSVKSVCDNFDSMFDHGFMDFSRYKSMVWKCQRIFTFMRWLAIWWKQRYHFEGNYKLHKKCWKILWISFLLMFHYWLMPNFLPKFQTTQLLTFSVPIIARI